MSRRNNPNLAVVELQLVAFIALAQDAGTVSADSMRAAGSHQSELCRWRPQDSAPSPVAELSSAAEHGRDNDEIVGQRT